MTYMLLSCLTLIISIFFLMLNHPLAMGIMLIIQTLTVAMIIGMMSKTFWLSYILFLTFLGGMLILFIYITSLASNEFFFFNMKMLLLMGSFFLIICISIYFMDKNMIYFYQENMEMKLNNMTINYMNENFLNLNKLYNFPINFITILLINYLFLTLIVIVKITNINKGPLRAYLN
uniref:NADH dehydrogenase subunit 6 n=1 Tax=Clogmia albipunctata TaxID=85120 RepID=UPI001EDD9044|nr:NADH dehydrogenase subunit 6 [Clogmia albipunctata]UHY38880.1 NADH dehydrogenase subunit 6 [Clogmia albipunctata]